MLRGNETQIIEVDPADLNSVTSSLLHYLLIQHPDHPFFDALESDGETPITYNVKIPHPLIPNKTLDQTICLTHTLIRFARSHAHDEYRYAICDKRAFQSGGEGLIYASYSTLKHDVIDNLNFTITYKTKKSGKERVLKELHTFNNQPKSSVTNRAMREGQFLRATSIFHTKNPILCAAHERAALLMLRIEGEELLTYAIKDAGEIDALDNYIEGSGNIFTVDQRLELTILLGDALLDLHDKGIIHRDIKAENIIVKLDQNNNPKSVSFIDLGIAKWENEAVDELIGTVECMAPEILYGYPADKLTDSYSFVQLLNETPWQNIDDARYNSLSSDHKMKIKSMLTEGKEKQREKRMPLERIIDEFKEIRAKRRESLGLQNRSYK